jgi:translation initiation factor 3 subunit I
MRLWSVQTGKCLYRWEFPTAVKRVAFSEDDDQVVCVTEQRMGHQGAIRVFNISREGDGTNRTFVCACILGIAISRLATLMSYVGQ